MLTPLLKHDALSAPPPLPALAHALPAGNVPSIPVIVDSPHSGRHMPFDWKLACDPYYIRQRTEDCFVDTLCEQAPDIGAHFLAAQTARAYLDVNRPLSSLMPSDLRPPLRVIRPSGAQDVNARNGRGLYWRICMAEGQRMPIIADADIPDEAALLGRIHTLWRPYHARLRAIVETVRARHGVAIHFNVHAFYPTGQKDQPEVVIGDLHGRSCASWLTRLAAAHFENHGYTTSVNKPYPGGEIIRQAAAPHAGVHSLQIELRKDLYMDCIALAPHQGFGRLQQVLSWLIKEAGQKARPV